MLPEVVETRQERYRIASGLVMERVRATGRDVEDWLPWGYRDADHTLDERITQRRWDVWGDDGRAYPAEPRWYRGEMRARDRRQRSESARRVREVHQVAASRFPSARVHHVADLGGGEVSIGYSAEPEE